MLKSQSRYFGYPFKCVNNQLRNVQLPAQSSQRWHQQIRTNLRKNISVGQEVGGEPVGDMWYHQRGPLEQTLFGPFPKLVLICINADFDDQGRIFQHFSSSTFFPLHHSRFLRFFRTFAPFFGKFDTILADFLRRQQISQIFVKF